MSDRRWKLFVVSHTHWDREWYQTYQQFRRRLVGMIDDLIEHLESDPEYRVFHMDGQTIVLRDYLEIRPGMADRLAALVRDGRIVIGPWYVMPDEFLVSGESIVRNLRRGIEMTRSYGVQPLSCGYVTDIFGHNSQTPQILRGFGIDNALLYRGIGDYPKDLFVWRGADGSDVLAMKMDRERSYSNFYFAIRWPFDGRAYDEDEVIERMRALIDFSQPLAVSENLLMLDGVDHVEIEPELPRLLSLINARMPDVEAVHARLEEYVDAQKRHEADCEVVEGELYRVAERGVNNQLLKNVLSSMVHLKQSNDAAERLLTRWAEPFSVFADPSRGLGNPGFLDYAWELLLQNHPHDSICGCSITEVHQDNEHRFKQVIEVGEDALDAAVARLAAGVAEPCGGDADTLVVFNPDTVDFTGLVTATIELPPRSLFNVRLYGEGDEEIDFQIVDIRRGASKKHHVLRRLADYLTVDRYEIAFQATVPACGYASFRYANLAIAFPGHGDYSFREFNAPVRSYETMYVGDGAWQNDHLWVRPESDGTLSVRVLATGREYSGLHAFEDRSDIGDGWNWRPAALDRVITSSGCPVTTSVVIDGPLVTEWEIRYRMEVPLRIDAGRTARVDETGPLELRTRVRMRRDSPTLEFTTEVDNAIEDHRLRVCFPTGLPTTTYYTTTPFALERRDVGREHRSTRIEYETGVVPNQGVVALADERDTFGVFSRGLYECEVTEHPDRTVALTLLRSFGNEVRRESAEMGYMRRKLTFEYALAFFDDVPVSRVAAEGDRWRVGMRSVCGRRVDPATRTSASYLRFSNRSILLSACEQRGEYVVLRLYNLSREPQQCAVEIGFGLDGAELVSLDEQTTDESAVTMRGAAGRNAGGTIEVSLGPAAIATLKVRPARNR